MLDSIAATDELFDLIPNQIDRAFFILHYYWGLTYKEIGYAFNVPEEYVEVQLISTKEALERKYA